MKQMVGIPGARQGTSAPINLDKQKIKGWEMRLNLLSVNFNECSFNLFNVTLNVSENWAESVESVTLHFAGVSLNRGRWK